MRHLIRSLGACALLAGSLLAGVTLPASLNTLRTNVTTSYTSLNGRSLAMVDAGATLQALPRLAVGAAYLQSAGQGRSGTRRYDADGWRAWGAWQVIPEDADRVGVALQADYLAQQVHLRSEDATSLFQADPPYAATGGVIRVSVPHGRLRWQGHVGGYRVDVNERQMATVALVGGQIDLPLGRQTVVQLGAAGYRDDYHGVQHQYEAQVAVRALQSERGGVTLGASYYPRGVPLAGTPLSPASAVGAIYGSAASSQLRTQPAGYLSLTGELRW